MAKRILGIAIISPIGVGLVIAGGWIFTLGASAILAIAAWEYLNFLHDSKFTPHKYFLIIATIVCAISRYIFSGTYFDFVFALAFMTSVILSLVRYENDDMNSLITLGLEVIGLIFIAYFGSYLISLRFLPDGKMWVLLAIPAIGCGDIGAFLIGSRFGKHKMAPKVSPHKSIEGYMGGILFTVLYALLFSLVFTFGAANITIARAVILGLILGIVSPLGDLLASLLKRSFNKKDSGKIIPGHGGILDRIDTWLLGGAAAYFVITFFWI
ncbi:MAG: phosphatidate cytidylyltransferase [Anaerolineaceae bacterium]